MKEIYSIPEMEIIEFNVAEVIRTSNGWGDDPQGGEGEDNW